MIRLVVRFRRRRTCSISCLTWPFCQHQCPIWRRNIMSRGVKRKDPRANRKCLFCPNHGLTLTHIWPVWLGKLLPFGDSRAEEFSIHCTDEDRALWKANNRRPGNVFSKKPYIACEKCNTGWMHKFEDEMVKFSKPIFTSYDPIRIQLRQIRVLSVWIALITILI